MNATEQIALLRRACEMVWDYSTVGNNMDAPEWRAKWGVPATHATLPLDHGVMAIGEALSATATPPDDDVARLTKERDDALAKLAAAQRELADIYAAKPGLEYRAQGVYVEHYGWTMLAACNNELDAERIADALNGGKP